MTDSWTAERMPDCSDRTVLITGANSGLGFEATTAFARKGATVVMACRSTERGERAATEIGDRVGSTGATLNVRECDLGSLDSVASFADGVRADYDRLDILCNNAGVMAIPRSVTADGFETQFGVNHLGHFALTGQLLPLLLDTEGETRVVTHSSGAHTAGEIDFDDLQREDSYGKWEAYGQSNLANLLFAYELQRRLDAAGVSDTKSVACHPWLRRYQPTVPGAKGVRIEAPVRGNAARERTLRPVRRAGCASAVVRRGGPGRRGRRVLRPQWPFEHARPAGAAILERRLPRRGRRRAVVERKRETDRRPIRNRRQ